MQPYAHFEHARSWQIAISQYQSIVDQPAVYMICCDQPFGRLKGQSDVLYIGATGRLGGDSLNCRLRGYRYPSSDHAREIKRKTELLISEGIVLTLKWTSVPEKHDALNIESETLLHYLQYHFELPPFNGRR